MKHTLTLLTALLLAPLPALQAAESAKPNVNVIFSDDLGYEAMGFLDEKVPDVTPNLSKLVSEGFSFQHGFVNNTIFLRVTP